MLESAAYSADRPNTLVWDSNLQLFSLAYHPDNTASRAREDTLEAIQRMKLERLEIDTVHRLGVLLSQSELGIEAEN